MTLDLPTELWIEIIRLAVTQWPISSFSPRTDQFSRINGFRKACERYKQITDSVQHENFVGSFDQFTFFNSPCNLVHHIRIRDFLPERQLYTQTFSEQFSDYTKLKSLSIASPDPLFSIKEVHNFSFASTLVRLDLCIAPKTDFILSESLDLPRLEELRIGLREGVKWALPFIHSRSIIDLCPFRVSDPEDFANNFVDRVRGSRNLRFISLGVAWDEEHDMRSLIASHELGIYHAEAKRPSDHYDTFYECKPCIEAYDHESVIKKEDTATRILAEGLPCLKRVSWTNAWGPIAEDETAQRGTNIVRSENRISLVRDDGFRRC